jgi:hypothetical protein
MPYLRDLFLFISYAGDKPHKILLPMIPASHVSDLSIVIGSLGSEELASENITILFPFLRTWTPYLQVLYVRAPAHPEVISYTESLKGLSRICISLGGIFNPLLDQQANRMTQVFDIKSNDVDFIGSSDTFQRFSGLEVSKLKLTVIHHEELPALHIIMSPSLWINLRSLEIVTLPKDWKGVSLPHVRKITLGQPSSLRPDPTSISALCKELASDISIFPSLQILKTRTIPEWDLLMIMLEKRNCWVEPNATRISSLCFSTVPPPFILRPLTQLLRGEFPFYESLEEFSLYRISNAYFDPSV